MQNDRFGTIKVVELAPNPSLCPNS